MHVAFPDTTDDAERAYFEVVLLFSDNRLRCIPEP